MPDQRRSTSRKRACLLTFDNELRFAREERLIDLDAPVTDDRSIDDDLIARMEDQDVIHDNLSRIKLLL
jgi:hypothetical protein